jgi:hypothetical protein
MELSLLHISSRKSGDPIITVVLWQEIPTKNRLKQADPDSCHTAFAGAALEGPVAKRYG